MNDKKEELKLEQQLRLLKDYDGGTRENYEIQFKLDCYLLTEDSDYLNQAIILAHKYSVPIHGIFLEFLAKEAIERYSRDEIAQNKIGKRNKIIILRETEQLHTEIFRLNFYCGLSIANSCALVSLKAKVENLTVQKKASTLEKEHPSWMKKNKEYIKKIKSYHPDKWSEQDIDFYFKLMGYDVSNPELKSILGERR